MIHAVDDSGIRFEACSGSIAGYEHTMPGRPGGKNNQDAFAILERSGLLVGAVFDGCGSTPHAEVGAALASRIVPQAVARAIEAAPDASAESIFAAATDETLARLEIVLTQIAGKDKRDAAVEEFFLFTTLGFAVGRGRALFFGAGDGVWALNGEVRVIDQQNQPAYLGYALADGGGDPLTLLAELPIGGLDSLLVGTDGILDLETNAWAPLPPRNRAVGGIAQFWQDDVYFKNADAVRRQLALANQDRAEWDAEAQRVRRHPGLLRDDATLIALRRRPVVKTPDGDAPCA